MMKTKGTSSTCPPHDSSLDSGLDIPPMLIVGALLSALILHGLVYWAVSPSARTSEQAEQIEQADIGARADGEQGIDIMLGAAGRSAGSTINTRGDDTLEQAMGPEPDPDSDARDATQRTFGPNLMLPSDLPEAAPDNAPETEKETEKEPEPLETEESVKIELIEEPEPELEQEARIKESRQAEQPAKTVTDLGTNAQLQPESEPEAEPETESEATSTTSPQNQQGSSETGDGNPAPPAATPLATSMMAMSDDPAVPGPLDSSANLPMASKSGRQGKSGAQEADQSGDGEPDSPTEGGGNPGSIIDYTRLIASRLAAVKEYPKYAEIRRHQGTAKLYFALNRQGQVIKAELRQRTGSWVLDKEVERMLQRALPFPPFPDGIKENQLELELPVEFYLEDQDGRRVQ